MRPNLTGALKSAAVSWYLAFFFKKNSIREGEGRLTYQHFN
jgi:hypothetical protein